MTTKNKAKRLVGLDFGLSRIGIALSDERQIFASPFLTFQTEKKLPQNVGKLIETLYSIEDKQNCLIEEVIIGLPLMMSGKTSAISDEVQTFVSEFKLQCSIPIRVWDERLTTMQAERSLKESCLSRKKRTKVVDIVSAAIILQSYLDHKALMREAQNFNIN